MTHFLVQTAAVVVLSVVVALVRSRRADRRRATVQAGDAATCRARLGVGTAPLTAGRLSLSPWQVVWTARSGDERADLAGAVVLSVAAAEGAGVEAAEDVVLRLGLPDGKTVRVQLYRDDAATLQRVLSRLDAAPAAAAWSPPPRVHRRPWWAVCCVTVAGLWVLSWAWLVVTGHTATATVTGGDGEGLCDVSWEEAGGTRATGEVDCADEPAGSHRTVWVLGWPVTGEPMDPGWTTGGVLVVGGLVAAPGALRLVQLRLRRRPRTVPPAAAAPLPREHQLLPDLDPTDLLPVAGQEPAAHLARLAPYARRQVPDDGWEKPGRPDGVRGPLRPVRLALGLRGPAVLVAVVLASTSWWSYRWLVLETTPTDAAVATSTGEVSLDGPGPLPDDVGVRYRGAAGPVHQADVATTRALPEGTQVRVEYATGHPGEVRLAGAGDGLGRGAALGGAGITVGLLWAGWRVRSTMRFVRSVHTAHRQLPRPALGLLTADGDGHPVVLLRDPLVSPPAWFAVPVEVPLPHGTASAFAAGAAVSVHGRLTDGGVVVVRPAADTPELLPAAPAVALGLERVAELLDSAGVLARSDEEL